MLFPLLEASPAGYDRGMERLCEISVLMENRPGANRSLVCEHGLSFFIDYGGRKILFDTGAGPAFLRNAECMNKRLSDLELLVVSHGHYDHSGGLLPLFHLLSDAGRETPLPMYHGEGFFQPKYAQEAGSPVYNYIGNPFQREDLPGLGIKPCPVETGFLELFPGCFLVGGFEQGRREELLSPRYVLDPEAPAPDPFRDEVALLLEGRQALTMICGCGHPGVLNMLDTVIRRYGKTPELLIGGIHMHRASEQQLLATARSMKELGVQRLGLNHCSGERTEECFKELFENSFPLRCGSSIRI